MVQAIGARWRIEEDLQANKALGLISMKWCDVKVVQVIVPSDTAVIREAAVPPAVSLSSKAERQRSVRSLLTTTLNHMVASETARPHWYLLASRRIGG